MASISSLMSCIVGSHLPLAPMAERSFPFVPRRSSELLAGDLWSIPLSDGRFACGRVLGHAEPSSTGATVSFIGGLHDWVADQPPNDQSIAGAAIRNVGRVHVAATAAGGGAVVGHRGLDLDGISCPSTVSNYWGDGYVKGPSGARLRQRRSSAAV